MLNKVIQKDHELVCSGCGCVLGEVEEQPQFERSTIPMSLNILLLGGALSHNVKSGYARSSRQADEERILRKLYSIVKHYSLPERFATETFSELKRKNRGFRSETEYLKQLIKILSKDDNYPYQNKMRLIKQRYESIINS